MKELNMYQDSQGVVFNNKLDAVLNDVKFNIQRGTNGFTRPYAKPYETVVSSKQLTTTLQWLYNNRERPELAAYLELLTNS